jgi:hypothetical protein
MKDYPQQIEQKLKEIADGNVAIGRLRVRIDKIEADTHVDIALSKGEDGKPLYSNDTLRKAAFTRQILENPEAAGLTEELEKLEKERLYALAEIERLRLEYKLFLLDREAEITR